MGLLDILEKLFTKNKLVFADAANLVLCFIPPLVRAWDLEDLDPVHQLVYLKGDSTDPLSLQRTRDVLKKWTVKTVNGTFITLIGIELQTKSPWDMAERINTYNVLTLADIK